MTTIVAMTCVVLSALVLAGSQSPNATLVPAMIAAAALPVATAVITFELTVPQPTP